MTAVLAAVDCTSATDPVLATAGTVARLLHADVLALHVGTQDPAPVAVADKYGVPLRVVPGSSVSAIIEAAKPADISLVVLAHHGLPGRHEAGQTALDVAAHLSKPVLVVPPEQPVRRKITRMLFPLDGSRRVSRGIRSLIATYEAAGVDVRAVHVFEPRTVPRFLDGAQDAAIWRDEFLAEHCAELGVQLETRPGPPAPALLEMAQSQDVDVIALGWRQDLSPERARVVRQVLAEARCPVALIPLPEPVQPVAGR